MSYLKSILEARAEDRKERADAIRERAAKKHAEADRVGDSAREMLDRIPMGQPILRGHHSERKHRSDLARIHAKTNKSIALRDEAKALESRADSIESTDRVSNLDPDALDVLRAKIAERVEQLAKLKKLTTDGRKVLRTMPRETWASELVRVGFRESTAHAIVSLGNIPPSAGNMAAEIRRLKERVEMLERRAVTPARETVTVGDITIAEEEGRVRVRFPSKPSEEVRARLRSSGFVWSPTAEAWQRQISSYAWQLAGEIAATCV